MKEFDKLIREIKECRYCENKFDHEFHPVVWGHQNAKIMQIGQAPSNKVNQNLVPFSDLSGKRLLQWYQIDQETFYDQDIFYLTSLAHCYPGKAAGSGDRPPPKCCYQKWLNQEMKLVNNEIYIIVGSYSAKLFFPDKKLTDLVFENQRLNNKLTIVLPHPSPLNMRWFKANPGFENRLVEIRKIIAAYCDLK